MMYTAHPGNLLRSMMLALLAMGMFSCSSPAPDVATFSGDQEAVALADQMFEAIGGKTAWCELTSLYIKAEHTEPQMEIPYQSEI